MSSRKMPSACFILAVLLSLFAGSRASASSLAPEHTALAMENCQNMVAVEARGRDYCLEKNFRGDFYEITTICNQSRTSITVFIQSPQYGKQGYSFALDGGECEYFEPVSGIINISS